MHRTRAERRHNDWKKARRKFQLDLDTAFECDWPNIQISTKTRYFGRYWLKYNNLHQYSKNKIHCSCWMCSPKTNPRKHKHMHGAPMRWSISDKRKIEDMNNQEQEQEQKTRAE